MITKQAEKGPCDSVEDDLISLCDENTFAWASFRPAYDEGPPDLSPKLDKRRTDL